MGVPALFRWLSEKYPKIVDQAKEIIPEVIDGVTIPVDLTAPNPNGVEFDNLYLDMNGIVHPCCHPEDKEAPENEEEMMVEIFNYLDRIMGIIRPRKLLYLAIDGVAPRAKMNQQRSRRFKTAQETRSKNSINEVSKRTIFENGLEDQIDNTTHFDSNCITPGTPFMDKLSNSLKYHIVDKLNNDPAWKNLNVILSDASVPGEGEHKIMDYIRRMRASPKHDPDTEHVIYGLDADLIMLSLATHEPRFKVLREDVSFRSGKSSGCRNCGRMGHLQRECRFPAKDKPTGPKPFVLLHVNVMREYLEVILQVPNLEFDFDLENAIDDWIFLIFFVGNDFLPHLPSLDIREGAVDKLINMWKKSLHEMGGYITNSGEVNLERAQVILTQLALLEDGILSNRYQSNLQKEARYRRYNKSNSAPDNSIKLVSEQTEPDGKRKREDESEDVLKKQVVSEPVVEDKVLLGTPGCKDRYYEEKFGVDTGDVDFRQKIAQEYIRGLCWVMRYYYQGCCSWGWFYPYHYPPFTSDLVNISSFDLTFDLGAPLKPFEQLMGVLPADSKQHLPEPFHFLMENPESPIIDFYPKDFQSDLNGKKHSWQAIALLPFIEEERLLSTIEKFYPKLTPDEHRRNSRGHEIYYIEISNPLYSISFLPLYEENLTEIKLNPGISRGISGTITKDHDCTPRATFHSPLSKVGCHDIEDDLSISARYFMPDFPTGFIFPAKLLSGITLPPKVLTDYYVDEIVNGGTWTRGRHDYQRHEYYKGRETYEQQTQRDLAQTGFSADSRSSYAPQFHGNAPRGRGYYRPPQNQSYGTPYQSQHSNSSTYHNAGYHQNQGYSQNSHFNNQSPSQNNQHINYNNQGANQGGRHQRPPPYRGAHNQGGYGQGSSYRGGYNQGYRGHNNNRGRGRPY